MEYYIVVYVTLINGSTPLTTPVLDDCTHYRIRKSCAWHSVGGGVFHLISQRFIWLICLFSPKSVDGNLYFLASQAKSLVLNFVSSCFIHSTSELTSSSDALQAPQTLCPRLSIALLHFLTRSRYLSYDVYSRITNMLVIQLGSVHLELAMEHRESFVSRYSVYGVY